MHALHVHSIDFKWVFLRSKVKGHQAVFSFVTVIIQHWILCVILFEKKKWWINLKLMRLKPQIKAYFTATLHWKIVEWFTDPNFKWFYYIRTAASRRFMKIVVRESKEAKKKEGRKERKKANKACFDWMLEC